MLGFFYSTGRGKLKLGADKRCLTFGIGLRDSFHFRLRMISVVLMGKLKLGADKRFLTLIWDRVALQLPFQVMYDFCSACAATRPTS